MMHCEKMRSLVWSSSIELWIDSTFDSTVVRHIVKKSRAKEAEPTGCPRRRNPERSSTGVGGSEGDVGCGSAEKRAIVLRTSVAKRGLVCWRVGGLVGRKDGGTVGGTEERREDGRVGGRDGR